LPRPKKQISWKTRTIFFYSSILTVSGFAAGIIVYYFIIYPAAFASLTSNPFPRSE